MAYHVVGYGITCTISDNGSGKARFTFPANTISRWVDALTLTDGSCYLWNLDLTAVSAITAKGGSQSAGYYYDSSLDYAGLAWTTAHRLYPVPSNTISNPTGTAAAKAASANADVWFMGYCDTAEWLVWSNDNILGATNTPIVDCYGLAGCRTEFIHAQYIFDASGDCSARNTQVKLRSLRMRTAGNCIYNRDTSGTFAGIDAEECELIGSSGIIIGASVAHDTNVFKNLHIISLGTYGIFNISTKRFAVYNTTIYGGPYGIRNSSSASTYKNVLVVGCSTSCFYQMTSAVVSYNASSDTTATGTGSIADLTPTQAALWSFNAGKFNPSEFRIRTTSTLYGAGNYTAGQPTTDIDGEDITTTCSIGCHKGTVNAYGVTWPTAAQLLAPSAGGPTSLQTFSGVLVGEALPAQAKITS